jgi:ubiquinone/menaquinone biosynthesis C-methylase UbiE
MSTVSALHYARQRPIMRSHIRPTAFSTRPMPNQRQLYNTVARDYDEAFAPHITAHYMRKRLALLGPLLNGGKGLDMGCGTGLLLKAMRAHGSMMGVEPSDGMLAVLREKQRGEAVQGSADALPFEDNRFDLVYSVAVFHHLITPELVAAALGEMVRVAKPGGAIVVWDHNPLNPFWPLIMKSVPQDCGEERTVPLRELLDGFTAAHATIERAWQCGFIPGFTPALAMPIARAFEWAMEHTPLIRRCCAHNVIVAKKRTDEHPGEAASRVLQGTAGSQHQNIQCPTSNGNGQNE